MQHLAEADLVSICEEGQNRHPIEQMLSVLALAFPELDEIGHAQEPIGRCDGRLLQIYGRMFGSLLSGIERCPKCAAMVSYSFPVQALQLPAPEKPSPPHRAVHGQYELTFRLANSLDLVAAAEGAGAASNLELAKAILVERCVLEASRAGTAVECSELPEDVIAELARRMGDLDPQADIELRFDCPECSHCWTAILDIGAFVWASVSRLAASALAEVHTLAIAYSWTESEIFSLSRRRRQAYIQLVRNG